MKKSNHRLSKFVSPERYEITMHPDLDNFTFKGEEFVHMRVNRSTRVLILHSLNLNITEAYWQVGKNKIVPKNINYDLKNETVSFNFAKNISGKGKLFLKFSGILQTALHGFYRSSYQHKNVTKHIATTQFEATDARRAFPCFDEPSQKAIFDVTIILPEHLTAISNTIESKILPHSSGYKVVKFQPTPKMSTYLLAFIVGDLEKAETKTKDGTVVRLFSTPGKTAHAKFALEVAKRGLEFMNEYFAIKYPLPVLDMIAIPDFSAAAMENWGAVTFRETELLVDEKNTPFMNRQRVAETVLHELVHQWFGNLVTMEWWTHLWLNESFASYMSYIAIDNLFPKWNIWTRFVLSDQNRGLLLDSLDSTHPVEVEVHHPNQIGQIFDAISYSKGASVLRMLANYIGEENFRNGLRFYLKKHSYKNTSSVHLWEAFEKVSGKPVRKFMKTWITKPGYPLVSVGLQKNKLSLTQEQFILDGKTSSKQLWDIPIQSQEETYKLNSKQKNFLHAKDSEFVKLNYGQHGFYRSAYDKSLLEKLRSALENQKLSAIDQVGLIRDQFQLCKAGKLDIADFLNLVASVKDYNSYVTWKEISDDLMEINDVLVEEKDRNYFENFAQQLFAPLVKKYGWKTKTGESSSHAMLRAVAILNAALYGDKNIIAQAKKLFSQYCAGKTLPVDLKSVVLQVAGHYGNASTHSKMLKLYHNAEMQEEKSLLAQSLVRFRKQSLFKKSLAFIFSSNVRDQNLPLLIVDAMANQSGRGLAWKQIQNKWEGLCKKYSDKLLLPKFVKGTGYFSTKKQYSEVKRFFTKHSHKGAENALANALENIQINISWKSKQSKSLHNYLTKTKSFQK